ncbi:MAG: hypothetical protein E3J87_08205 [Candidatus Cloacimonadota bacterium]|nr:MAG: hypothetical protein E3J87_08205 [Candidatus Cloacimonadota bacterium]
MIVTPALMWGLEGERTRIKRFLIPILFVSSYIFGVMLFTLFYGLGVAITTILYANKASHPLVYFIFGGFVSLTSMFPPSSGDNPDFISSIHSLAFYIIFVIVLRGQEAMAHSILASIATVGWYVWLIFVCVMIGILISMWTQGRGKKITPKSEDGEL